MPKQPQKIICEICGGKHSTFEHEEATEIRKIKKSKELLKSKEQEIRNRPSYITTSRININGEEGRRLMVVYRTTGCAYDKNGKGCTMCDFRFYADPNISAQNIKEQHAKILKQLPKQKDGFIQFDLLTLGNFYNDEEISPGLRDHLLTTLARVPRIKRVLTESRRQYVTADKLRKAKRCLRDDQILEYALGYETVTEEIRNKVLRKGVPESHLDEALDLCKEAGIDFVAYVLIKPHTLSEAEAIQEAVNTALHVLQKAKAKGVTARIAFEPVFVTKGKVLEELFLRGEYTPPKLWSVVEVIKRTAQGLKQHNTEGKLFVGLSDESLSDQRMTANCGKCDHHVIDAIQRFNQTQDVSVLENLDCECKRAWESAIQPRESVQE